MTVSTKILTIGMATYEDFDGVYFTLQSLNAHHSRDIDIIVIDNAPKKCKRTQSSTLAVGGKYFHRPDLVGTSAPRDACFRFAETPWVMVCDSHVLFESGCIQTAIDYARNHPDSKDMIQGPIIWDHGKSGATHWKPKNNKGLWGVWETDDTFKAFWGNPNSPEWDYKHARVMSETLSPFEIPMQGLGMWMMRKEAWPGFHYAFRGFGGEEGYIHEWVRRNGGKALCHPGLRWRHRFRDIAGWAANGVAPYKPQLSDHTFNLLVGHRELGIDAIAEINEEYGKRLPDNTFQQLVQESQKVHPEFGNRRPDKKKLRILGVWYSNNAAPNDLIRKSLGTIYNAQKHATHEVEVRTCPWESINGNPFKELLAKEKLGNHLGIIRQIRQLLNESDGVSSWDIICFLEHDVLYPENYFDKVGDAFANNDNAQVVMNDDYEGLNGTGWLKVRERHAPPMHQLSMRYEFALDNLDRAEQECLRQGWAYLEPDSGPNGDRSHWLHLPVTGLMPAIHVNHPRRFTSHGEVVYEQHSNGKTWHDHWGDMRQWWGGEVTVTPPNGQPQPKKCGGCSKAKAQQDQQSNEPLTLANLYKRAMNNPSDFHEHVQTLKLLADKCEKVAEISAWGKSALISLAMSNAKDVYSYCRHHKGEWGALAQLSEGRVKPVVIRDNPDVGPLIPDVDLLFLDTKHTADQVFKELSKYHVNVNRYIVIHTTVTFGEVGDDGGPGVMHGIRKFLQTHSEWSVIKEYRNNHGMIVLSKNPDDRSEIHFGVRDAFRYAKSKLKHKLDGGLYLPLEMAQERIDKCLTCPERGGEEGGNCTVCKCYLFRVPDEVPVVGGAAGKVWLPHEKCPLDKWGPKSGGVEMSPEELNDMIDKAFDIDDNLPIADEVNS